MKVVGIINGFNDIYTNLASEEFLLRFNDENMFMLWESDPAVVIGKHQNAFAEFNLQYIRNKDIKVARRISGGGTVYHGPGNLNFTFIMNGQSGKLVDFGKFVSPVMAYLKTLDLEPYMGDKNEILIDGLKISGNAEHIYKNRTLHHGTLLFNCDLTMLNDSLKVKKGIYRDKAVKSNRATVTNIVSHLRRHMDIKSFREGLFEFLQVYYGGAESRVLSEIELKHIQNLRNEKYITGKWIYGYSPDFRLQRQLNFNGTLVDFELTVKKGIISEYRLLDSAHQQYNDILKLLPGVFYETDSIRDALSTSGEFLLKKQMESLVNTLFPEEGDD